LWDVVCIRSRQKFDTPCVQSKPSAPVCTASYNPEKASFFIAFAAWKAEMMLAVLTMFLRIKFSW